MLKMKNQNQTLKATPSNFASRHALGGCQPFLCPSRAAFFSVPVNVFSPRIRRFRSHNSRGRVLTRRALRAGS
jgi:hypothetical protein